VKERIYDRAMTRLDARGLGERRDRLAAGDLGDVLEIGAGTGLNLPRYRGARRVVALEPDPRFRSRLAARAGRAPVPAEVVAGVAEDLPFPDATFDTVVCSLALCSVGNLDRAVAEIARVLRPGGAVHLLEHVRGTGRLARWQRRLTPLHRRIAGGCHLDRDPLGALSDAGFSVATADAFRFPRGHPLIRDGVQAIAVREIDGPATG
jgi:SAM-dependent methyltransferase